MTTDQLRAQVAAQVAALPTKPGVYTFRDAAGRVIYVGKAANLRSRVRSYFGSPRALEGKTRQLAAKIAQLDIVTTRTEQDALHLEATLVKRHQPFFNVRLKDDKHYPYLKVDVDSPWPRVTITRRVQNDGARYFGPYASAKSIRTSLDLVKKLFPWRSCDKEITGSDPRPCLEYYIRRCIAPCTSYCTPDEYREVIDQTMLFLDGKSSVVVEQLSDAMGEAAEELNFERAAILRDQLSAVQRVTEQQLTADSTESEIDAFGIAVDGDEAVVQVLFIRGQKMTGSDHFSLAGVKDEPLETVLASFLRQYYEGAVQVPRLVLIPNTVDQIELLNGLLAEKRGSAVEIRHAQRGEKRRLVEMATENAREALDMQRVRWMADRGHTAAALAEVEQALALPAPPNRIECYDISHNQGDSTVASMVVFLDGRPATREYRRFRIKSVDGPDDFTSMAEVIRRRFRRLGELRQAEAARGYDVPADLANTNTAAPANGQSLPRPTAKPTPKSNPPTRAGAPSPTSSSSTAVAARSPPRTTSCAISPSTTSRSPASPSARSCSTSSIPPSRSASTAARRASIWSSASATKPIASQSPTTGACAGSASPRARSTASAASAPLARRPCCANSARCRPSATPQSPTLRQLRA